ncbi:MAG: hypothetical protein HC932_05940 [Thermales bacterium]|nr:hypothetical protein [Thermales bacterium]
MKDFGTNKKNFQSFLQEFLDMEHEIHQTKKVGISVPFKLSHNVINIAKKSRLQKKSTSSKTSNPT